MRLLRSRNLAVWLLVLLAGVAALGTLVPQWKQPAEVAAWDARHRALAVVVRVLGLHSTYSSPLFLGILVLLWFSTTVCSIDRTRYAVSRMKRRAGIPEPVLARMARAEPLMVVHLERGEAIERVKAALRSMRLDVRATKRAVEGEAGRYGPLGSPVFHWSLTLLFVAIVVGQLTHAEGQMGVPVGGELPNVRASYVLYTSGAWHSARYADIQVAVVSVNRDKRRGKLEIGYTPTVEFRRGDRVLARGESYPNHPFRWGPFLVHYVTNGYTGLARVTLGDGSASETRLYFDFDSSGGFGAASLDLPSTGAALRAVFEPVSGPSKSRAAQARRRVRASIVSQGATQTSSIVTEGQPVRFDGGEVTLSQVDEYARLSVVEDASVLWVYLLFGLATIGIAVATLMPRRAARVLLREGEKGLEIVLETEHQRRDPSFVSAVTLALNGALGHSQKDMPADGNAK
jgi:cytochrome c biogenesis protein ResB